MAEKLLILDGGLGTLLFSRKAFNKGDPLWSVRCLVSPPESEGRHQLRQAHLDFLAAGANIIKTNSYQMTPAHLRKCIAGLSEVHTTRILTISYAIHFIDTSCLHARIDTNGLHYFNNKGSCPGNNARFGSNCS